MKRAFDLTINRAQQPEARQHLASWYTQGLSDGLGDRLLMFDNSSASSLELLRFKREFAATPGFETALRQRVERLNQFRHPSFARVRAVDWLGSGGGLALISNYTEGRRLSDVLDSVRGPKFAMGLIKQLTPLLATLQQQGDGIAHGVLTAERIIVTPEGRLVIVEHVLGSAVQCLYLPESRLRSELGLAIPASSTGVVRLDGRTDILQLGFVALSLLLGRRLTPAEYPQNAKRLLEELARVGGSSLLAAPLLTWLERALQLNGRTFDSADDAHRALDEFPEEDENDVANPERGLLTDGTDDPDGLTSAAGHFPPIVDPDFQRREPPPALAVIAREPLVPESIVITDSKSEPVSDAPKSEENTPAVPEAAQDMDDEMFSSPPARTADLGTETDAAAPERPPSEDENFAELLANEVATIFKDSPLPSTPYVTPSSYARAESTDDGVRYADAYGPEAGNVWWRRQRPLPIRTITAAVATLALVEAVVILALLLTRSTPVPATPVVGSSGTGAGVPVDSPRAGGAAATPPAAPSKPAESKPAAPVPNRRDARAQPAASPTNPPVAVVDRSGKVRVTSPIELQIFENGRALGSSGAGAFTLSAGRHELDVANDVLAYRSHHVVDVKAGQIAALAVMPPNGRVSINALPWAEVWIDGNPVGETPLGNVAVPLGEHEIIFRHPQLGERRQTTVVKYDVLTRVSVNLQR